MSESTSPQAAKLEADRQLLIDAEAKGGGAKLGAFMKLSGPGWLQSAITLGGGSLSGALFLGILGGVSMLWLQLVAIIMGVIMLSAISYVTLSTGKKPFRAINEHINPALGWSWAIATCAANMLWCMPQFSLSFAALNKNLLGSGLGESLGAKLGVSAVLLTLAMGVIWMNAKGGKAGKAFDWFLKGLVGLVVISFFGVVVYLGFKQGLEWGNIFAGFVPDLSQWSNPSGKLAEILPEVPQKFQSFWSELIVEQQRDVMIGAAATAVGINMTFLLPYSMLNRGWDKSFRGLARFDLSTGMAIPYVLVTTCVVIAAASQFHAIADNHIVSDDSAVMIKSELFGGLNKAAAGPYDKDHGKGTFKKLSDSEKLPLVAAVLTDEKVKKDDAVVNLVKRIKASGEKSQSWTGEQLLAGMASLSVVEKKVASSLHKRNASQLSLSLEPLLGKGVANYVFGIGVLGMGFSTIIILMLINGYVVCEMLGQPQGGRLHIIGCLLAGLCGAVWPLVWDGPAKLWLAITVSAFGMMLLPIAYFTFFFMMNSKSLMGEHKPKGRSLIIWNLLMGFSVFGAVVAAASAIYAKSGHPIAGIVVKVVGGIFVVALIAGFFMKQKAADPAKE
jgi:Mn2+/Fe2+ NRAMP family transporter